MWPRAAVYFHSSNKWDPVTCEHHGMRETPSGDLANQSESLKLGRGPTSLPDICETTSGQSPRLLFNSVTVFRIGIVWF